MDRTTSQAVTHGLGEWPFVGRADLAHRVLSALASRRVDGVVLRGPMGVGKTRLAAEVGSGLAGKGVAVHRILAAAGGGAFGAVAHLLPSATDTSDPLAVGAALADALRTTDGEQAVVVVDDLPALDPATAGALASLVVAGRVGLLATARDGERLPDAFAGLAGSERVAVVGVEPLDERSAATLLHLALGGPVDGMAAAALTAPAAGNPLFLRELVLLAVEDGALADAGGVWLLQRDLPRTTRLREVVESRLRSLSEGATAALELLALCQPVQLEELETEAGLDAIEELEARGLLQVEVDGSRTTVLLDHPFHAEAVRLALPTLRARSILRRHLDRLEAVEPVDDLGRRRRVRLRLAAGVPVDVDELADTGGRAFASGDLEAAVELLVPVLDAAPSWSGRAHGRPRRVRAGRLRPGRRRHGHRDGAGADARRPRRCRHHPLAGAPLGLGHRRSRHRAAGGGARRRRARRRAAGAALERDRFAPRVHRSAGRRARPPGVGASVARGGRWRHAGLPHGARAVGTAGRGCRSGPGCGRRGTHGGPAGPRRPRDPRRLPRVRRWPRPGCSTRPTPWRRRATTGPRPTAARSPSTGSPSCSGAPTSSVASWPTPSSGSCGPGPSPPTPVWGHRRGRPSWASPSPPPSSASPGSRPPRPETWPRPPRSASSGPRPASPRAGRASSPATSSAPGPPSATRPSSPSGPGTAPRRPGCGTTWRAWASRPRRHPDWHASPRWSRASWSACAVTTPGPSPSATRPGLHAAGERFEALGALLLAAEAFTSAAERLRAGGDQRGGAGGRCARRRPAGPLPGRPDAVGGRRHRHRGAAHRREREVALLAARGMQSRAIADQLFLSFRTVNNHLQRAYEKLGINGRAELAAALGIDQRAGSAA